MHGTILLEWEESRLSLTITQYHITMTTGT